MAPLTVIYDTMEPPLVCYPPDGLADKVKVAVLPLADDLTALDVYEVARRLAELLLEQLTR